MTARFFILPLLSYYCYFVVLNDNAFLQRAFLAVPGYRALFGRNQAVIGIAFGRIINISQHHCAYECKYPYPPNIHNSFLKL